tara:strand:- start:617 stop:856 length:240 start_codon:yes stop_codon:yes gene_type:complete
MGRVIEFESFKDQFDTQDLLDFKAMVEVQLQAARSFSEPLLENLAWINQQLTYNEAGQLNLPFENNLIELIENESNFNI